MSKELVTADQLANWITTELQKVEGCQYCKITGVTPLREPDSEGCNWSDSVTVSSGGVPADYFMPPVQRIILEARKKFNLG